MRTSLFLITFIGIALAAEMAFPADTPAPAATKAEPPTAILCGVSPKSKDLISDSTALSKGAESLDLLLEALSPGQSKALEKILNQGSIEELVAIDGIAEGRAKTIIAKRPYKEVKELMLIRGFGYATVASVIMHGNVLKP